MKNTIVLLLCLPLLAWAQQKEVRLYKGAAPGSEGWNWEEKQNNKNAINLMTVYNVVNPTLTVFPADNANGAVVIVCPGGGFHFLSINSEGNEVARWLVKKGVTVFVLKYRVAHVTTDDPFGYMLDQNHRKEWDAEMVQTIPFSVADGREAISYVRGHAAEYGIDQNRIGIIGFSAGGTVAASAAFNYSKDNRPDFVAPIYAYMPASLMGDVKDDAPPMFLVCATDDQINLAPHSIELYNRWLASKHSAEMHLYAKGGHGFGMNVQHLPADHWIDRFGPRSAIVVPI